MKKKVFYGLGITIVGIGIILISMFMLLTKDVKDEVKNNNVSTESFLGTWIVTRYAESPVKNEYWDFTENVISHCSETDVYVESAYDVKEEGRIRLIDSSQEMIVECVSNNIIKLVEADTELVWYLLKKANNQNDVIKSVDMEGKWKVKVHAGTQVLDETMIFEKGTISGYRDGNKEPYYIAQYTWNEEGKLYVEKLALELTIYLNDDNTIGMIETATGYVWEIERTD